MSAKKYIEKIYTYLLGKKEKYRLRKEYFEYVSKMSGWSMSKTKAEMIKARAKGITFKYYAKKKLWNRSETAMKRASEYSTSSHKKNVDNRKKYVEKVCMQMGWSEEKAQAEIIKAKEKCGCSVKDYWMFRLYELSPEEQQTYFTLGVFEDLIFKYNTDAEAQNILLRKNKFAHKFNDLMGRKWFVNRDITFEKFLEKVQGLDSLIIKPTSSTQGKNIEKIKFADFESMKDVYKYIMAKRKMICEEVIVQHHDIAAMNDSCVNTIRVLTVVDEGKCYHVYAGFRMGQGGHVDNFHAGGIIASIDVATGITCMSAIDVEGNHYLQHPISKRPTQGFQIPNWQEVLKITQEAALRLEGAAIVGWDVAVTESGACLVEGNSEPSHTIIQLPYVETGVGMKKIVERFLS